MTDLEVKSIERFSTALILPNFIKIVEKGLDRVLKIVKLLEDASKTKNPRIYS